MKINFLIIIIFFSQVLTSCSQQPESTVLDVLKVPAYGIQNGHYLYVHDVKTDKIYCYKDDVLVHEFDQYPFAGDEFCILDSANTIAGRLAMSRAYIQKSDGEDLWKEMGFAIQDVARYKNNTILALGLHDGKLFHVLNQKLQVLEHFGTPPNSIDQNVGLLDFSVSGDSVFVCSAQEYKVYIYVNKELTDSLCVDRDEIQGISTKNGSTFRLSGMNGITVSNTKLFISTYCHKPINKTKAVSSFTLDVFDRFDHTLLYQTTYDSVVVPMFANDEYLYVIEGCRVMKRRLE